MLRRVEELLRSRVPRDAVILIILLIQNVHSFLFLKCTVFDIMIIFNCLCTLKNLSYKTKLILARYFIFPVNYQCFSKESNFVSVS